VLEHDDREHGHVDLLAGLTSGGEPVFEQVPAAPLGDERFRILASPALLDGIAAGDVIVRSADGTYELRERSGNLCVQVLYPGAALHERVDAELVPGVAALGGWLDARGPGASAFTLPLSAGWSEIQGLFDGWTATADGAGWSYANVYDTDGVTPLRWWEDARFTGRGSG
jgi:hypothetical protein